MLSFKFCEIVRNKFLQKTSGWLVVNFSINLVIESELWKNCWYKYNEKFLFYHCMLYLTLYKKMRFSIKNFFSKCDQIRSFAEEILHGKLRFWQCNLSKFCFRKRFTNNFLIKNEILYAHFSGDNVFQGQI